MNDSNGFGNGFRGSYRLIVTPRVLSKPLDATSRNAVAIEHITRTFTPIADSPEGAAPTLFELIWYLKTLVIING